MPIYRVVRDAAATLPVAMFSQRNIVRCSRLHWTRQRKTTGRGMSLVMQSLSGALLEH